MRDTPASFQSMRCSRLRSRKEHSAIISSRRLWQSRVAAALVQLQALAFRILLNMQPLIVYQAQLPLPPRSTDEAHLFFLFPFFPQQSTIHTPSSQLLVFSQLLVSTFGSQLSASVVNSYWSNLLHRSLLSLAMKSFAIAAVMAATASLAGAQGQFAAH
jgi:hypothetical protein